MSDHAGDAPADRVVRLPHALFAVGDRPAQRAGGDHGSDRPPLAAVADLPMRTALELLASVTDGRLVHSAGDLPPFRAAGHVVEDGHLVVRVRPPAGCPTSGTAVPAWLSYRSDSTDEDGLAGWVVTAAGPAREITEATEQVRLHVPARGRTGADDRLVRIRISRIVGHRLDVRTPR